MPSLTTARRFCFRCVRTDVLNLEIPRPAPVEVCPRCASVPADLGSRLSPFRPRSPNRCNTMGSDIILGTLGYMIGLAPLQRLYDFNPLLPFFHRLKHPFRMAPKYSRPGGPTPSSLASVSYPRLRPLTTLPFAPRSTPSNKTLSLSPAMVGGTVAIGLLAFLFGVGVGLVLHVRCCRQSGCSVRNAIGLFTRLRRDHSTQGPYSRGLAGLLTGPLITNLL